MSRQEARLGEKQRHSPLTSAQAAYVTAPKSPEDRPFGFQPFGFQMPIYSTFSWDYRVYPDWPVCKGSVPSVADMPVVGLGESGPE